MNKLAQHTIGKPQLGGGIFTTKDVANILRLPPSKVRRWLAEFWDRKFGGDKTYSFGSEGRKAVNFYTLIEFFVFYQLREQHISAQAIQKAHKEISELLGTAYPFAYADISHDGKKVWYETLEALLKADGKHQISIKGVIQPFLKKIQYDKDKIAERYFPLDHSKNVVIDPKHQFGQPVVNGTNIKTETLYNLYKGGESDENICILYGLSKDKVKDALNFHLKDAA